MCFISKFASGNVNNQKSAFFEDFLVSAVRKTSRGPVSRFRRIRRSAQAGGLIPRITLRSTIDVSKAKCPMIFSRRSKLGIAGTGFGAGVSGGELSRSHSRRTVARIIRRPTSRTTPGQSTTSASPAQWAAASSSVRRPERRAGASRLSRRATRNLAATARRPACAPTPWTGLQGPPRREDFEGPGGPGFGPPGRQGPPPPRDGRRGPPPFGGPNAGPNAGDDEEGPPPGPPPAGRPPRRNGRPGPPPQNEKTGLTLDSKELFKRCDKNGDGSLSEEEFVDGLQDARCPNKNGPNDSPGKRGPAAV